MKTVYRMVIRWLLSLPFPVDVFIVYVVGMLVLWGLVELLVLLGA